MVAPHELGQIRGKYALDRRLGCGGMAEVFIGRTLGVAGFTRPIAIKRIHPGYSADPRFREMFIAEARLSARLCHDNVVSILDFDEDESGRLFLVMELVDGTDLTGLLETGLLPLPVVLFVTKEILRGLGFAHDLPISDDGVRGLVHRDVSPHNVLLSWDGAVRVSDFGIAKARSATEASASVFIKGKPAYMSPEQANGQSLDGRSDLFAVGVMLWEMLCATPLFSRESTQATLKSLLFDPVPLPRTLRPDVPADIERVTMRLLEKERDDRYRNADAAIADLASCAAFPRDGRELLSAILFERLPERVRHRHASRATKMERPEAVGSAAVDPARTGTSDHTPGAARVPAADPFDVAEGALRARARVVRLLMLGTSVVLASAIGIGAALYLEDDPSAATSSTTPAPPAAAAPAVAIPAPAPSQSADGQRVETQGDRSVWPEAGSNSGSDASVSVAVPAPLVPDPRAPKTPPQLTPDRARKSNPTPPKAAGQPSDRGGIREVNLGSAN